MHQHGLVSSYTKKKYKPHSTGCNESPAPNILNRDFSQKQALNAVVSDLTYVDINGSWHYICLVVDLWNREIIGWSVGKQKNAALVQEALHSIPYNLKHINVFHSDRGKEFDNKLIDEVVETFKIKHSLSHKGCPYDNAVIEATNKTLKVEFVYQHKFTSLEELRLLLFDYIHWYNHHRLHSSLNYQAPISIRKEPTLALLYQTTLIDCPKKC